MQRPVSNTCVRACVLLCDVPYSTCQCSITPNSILAVAFSDALEPEYEPRSKANSRNKLALVDTTTCHRESYTVARVYRFKNLYTERISSASCVCLAALTSGIIIMPRALNIRGVFYIYIRWVLAGSDLGDEPAARAG